MGRGVMLIVIAVSAAVVVLAAACGSASNASGIKQPRRTVYVIEKEWVLRLSRNTVKAGPLTFWVENKGRVAHELVVLRTTRRPGSLPVKNGRAVISGRVAALGKFKPGEERGLGVSLKSGRYVLLCNLPGHYRAGQYSAFRVTG